MKKNKGRLFVLCGIPRSGKSTIAERWLNHEVDIYNWKLIKGIPKRYDGQTCRLTANPRIVVCGDKIRLALHGQRFTKEAEQFVHSIKNLIIKMYLEDGYDVLIDGTHTSKYSWRELLALDPSPRCCIIDTPPELCKERARQCGQDDLVDAGVIDRMSAQLNQWKDNPQQFLDSIL